MEPAVFMAGITSLKFQTADGRNHLEMYLKNYYDYVRVEDCKVLLISLYEAQNDDIIQHYFTARARRNILIGSGYSNLLSTAYDFYALSYCLAHSSDHFRLSITIKSYDDVSLLETLVKGLKDHCTSITPLVEYLSVEIGTQSDEVANKTML